MLQPRSTTWALILTLAGACILAAGGLLVSLPGAPACSRTPTRVEHDLRVIITVAEAIYTDTGRYPESSESMVGFKNEDGTAGIAALEKYPKDPWGHEYLYEITSDGSPRVTCLGSDNQPGGVGDAADTVLPNEEDR